MYGTVILYIACSTLYNHSRISSDRYYACIKGRGSVVSCSSVYCCVMIYPRHRSIIWNSNVAWLIIFCNILFCGTKWYYYYSSAVRFCCLVLMRDHRLIGLSAFEDIISTAPTDSNNMQNHAPKPILEGDIHFNPIIKYYRTYLFSRPVEDIPRI